MGENVLSDEFFINEQKKLNQRYKKKGLILLLGATAIIPWIGIFIQLFNAFFFDRSIILGFSEEYGIVVVAYNAFNELIFEIFLFSGFFILSIVLTIYLVKKVR